MKTQFPWLILIPAFYLMPVISFGQIPEPEISADKTRILIGEPVNVRLQLTMRDNTYRLSWPDIQKQLTPSFVLVSNDPVDTSYATGWMTYSQQLQITSFDSGQQFIPSFVFQLDDFNRDTTLLVGTDSVAVEVTYSPDDGVLPFHDIKPAIDVRRSFPWWFWPAVLTAVVVLVLIIMWVVNRVRNRNSGMTSSGQLSDYDEAVGSLKALDEERVAQTILPKAYYLQLRQILKRYLSRLLGQNKSHLGSDDLIIEISEMIKDRLLLEKLAVHLRIGDAVKFARYECTSEDQKESIGIVTEIVDILHQQKKQVKDDL